MEMVISGVALALLGILAVLLGLKCLGAYRPPLTEQPLYAMAWDIFVSALRAGTPLGYLAALLFKVGGSFIVIGLIVAALSLLALFLR